MNPPAAKHSEVARQLVHISMGGFALLLRWISWPQALALAGGALIVNLFLLPHFTAQLYRPGDRARSLHGIVYYPLSVVILLLLFPRRLDIVAAAWGILAAGDGIATLAGRAIGGARWAWNPDKTVAGLSRSSSRARPRAWGSRCGAVRSQRCRRHSRSSRSRWPPLRPRSSRQSRSSSTTTSR
jgi:hypothetical protein